MYSAHTHTHSLTHIHTYGLPWQNGRLAGVERFRQQGSRLMRWKQSLTSISIAEKFHHSRQIESYEVKICYKLCGVAPLLKAQGTIFIASMTLPLPKLLFRHNQLYAMWVFFSGYQPINFWVFFYLHFAIKMQVEKYSITNKSTLQFFYSSICIKYNL